MPQVTLQFSAEAADRIKEALREAVDLAVVPEGGYPDPDENGDVPDVVFREPTLDDLKDILRSYLKSFVHKSETRRAATDEIEVT